MKIFFSLKALTTAALLGTAGFVLAHGNVTPQPVDTGNLPVLGDELLAENPFRKGGSHGDANSLAVEIGESAYAGNCAGCHGIRAMSGGLTPDLRELTEWDDEGCFRVGYMPACRRWGSDNESAVSSFRIDAAVANGLCPGSERRERAAEPARRAHLRHYY